jgi:hypothetical protein
LEAVPGIRVGSPILIAMPDGRDIEATVIWTKSDAFGVKFQFGQPASSSEQLAQLQRRLRRRRPIPLSPFQAQGPAELAGPLPGPSGAIDRIPAHPAKLRRQAP